MHATPQQLEQIKNFFRLIGDYRDDILLHPIIDDKTGVERLGVCVADRDDGSIYLLGVLFLPYDKLYNRFSFKEDEPAILMAKSGRFCKWISSMKRRLRLLWND